MDVAGLIAGFLTALCSSIAFLSSTWALKRTPGLSAPGLLADAGIVMGVLSIALLGIFWEPRLFSEGFAARLPALLGAAVFFSLGQTLVFTAQRSVEASRVVPLLGLKLPVLAVISVCFMHDSIGWLKCVAIALAVLSAFVLNNAGTRIPAKSFLLVIAACVSYSLSDTYLTKLTDLIERGLSESTLMAAIHCTILTYIMVGLIAACILAFWHKPLTRAAFAHSVPFSVFWLGCIVALNIAFARLGTVHGVILQNTRAIWTILLTPVFIMLGCTALETRLTASLFWRRLAASAMVLLAAFLYSL